jgi:hypothetical protein
MENHPHPFAPEGRQEALRSTVCGLGIDGRINRIGAGDIYVSSLPTTNVKETKTPRRISSLFGIVGLFIC